MTPGWYQAHLDRVSRSFAFCIAQLPEPLRHWTALSYLLCRVLDTLEDAPWGDRAAQAEAFTRLEALLGASPAPSEVAAWAGLLPAGVLPAERTLVQEAGVLFEDLGALPAEVAETVVQTVREMAAGMRHYGRLQAASGRLQLAGLGEVNRYCYFVAGTVGRLLSRLVMAHRPGLEPPAGWGTASLHFGLFLQKVNLLKDQAGDEAEGRYLVPDRALVLASAVDNAHGALAYLAGVPRDEEGYRRFCGWSLFLGTASLGAICRGWRGQGPGRLERPQAVALLAQVDRLLADDRALAALLAEHLAALPTGAGARPERAAAGAGPGWFTQLAGRFLKPPLAVAELAELGLA